MLALSHKELFFQKSVKPYFVRAKLKKKKIVNRQSSIVTRSDYLRSEVTPTYEVNKSIESGV